MKVAAILKYFRENGFEIIDKGINPDLNITGPRSVIDGGAQHISFIGKKMSGSEKELVQKMKCRLVLLDKTFVESAVQFSGLDSAFIISEDPKRDLVEFLKINFSYEEEGNAGIHPSAVVADSAVIGEGSLVEANAVIGRNVTIGQNCRIASNVVIGWGCTIGNEVEIGPNTTIGGIGFGYYQKEKQGRYYRVPHFGSVIIEDDVHIGANTCIDRGSLSDTILHSGVRVDNLVHIAHNVEIGENSLVIACSMVAGSVKIGRNSWIAPCASIKNGLTIGDNVTVGLGAVVVKNVPDDLTVAGIPAKPFDQYKRLLDHQKKISSGGE